MAISMQPRMYDIAVVPTAMGTRQLNDQKPAPKRVRFEKDPTVFPSRAAAKVVAKKPYVTPSTTPPKTNQTFNPDVILTGKAYAFLDLESGVRGFEFGSVATEQNTVVGRRLSSKESDERTDKSLQDNLVEIVFTEFGCTVIGEGSLANVDDSEDESSDEEFVYADVDSAAIAEGSGEDGDEIVATEIRPWTTEMFRYIDIGKQSSRKTIVDVEELAAGDRILQGVIRKRYDQAASSNWKRCMGIGAMENIFNEKARPFEVLWDLVEKCTAPEARAGFAKKDVDLDESIARPGFSDKELNMPGVYESVPVTKDDLGGVVEVHRHFDQASSKMSLKNGMHAGVATRLAWYDDLKRKVSDPAYEIPKATILFARKGAEEDVVWHFRKSASFPPGMPSWAPVFIEGLSVDAGTSLGRANVMPGTTAWDYANGSLFETSGSTVPIERHHTNFLPLNQASPVAQMTVVRKDLESQKVHDESLEVVRQDQGGACGVCGRSLLSELGTSKREQDGKTLHFNVLFALIPGLEGVQVPRTCVMQAAYANNLLLYDLQSVEEVSL